MHVIFGNYIENLYLCNKFETKPVRLNDTETDDR